MENVKPPFKVDIAGTFLYPQALKEAREQCRTGKINPAELRAVEDVEIRNLVDRLKSAGLKVVTDGNFRTPSWPLEFMCALDGIDLHPVKKTTIELTSRICVHRHPVIDDFMFLTGITGGDLIAKQILPAPSLLLARLQKESPAQLKHFYPVMDHLYEDIHRIYHRIINALYDSGCRYIQFRDTTRLVTAEAIQLNNTLFEALSADLSVAFHAPGDMLISTVGVDIFFLDYDDECCSRYKLLWFIKEEKAAFGFIPSYYPVDDELDELRAKIDEVRRYIPLDRFSLCIPNANVLPSEKYEVAQEKQWHTLEMAMKVSSEALHPGFSSAKGV